MVDLPWLLLFFFIFLTLLIPHKEVMQQRRRRGEGVKGEKKKHEIANFKLTSFSWWWCKMEGSNDANHSLELWNALLASGTRILTLPAPAAAATTTCTTTTILKKAYPYIVYRTRASFHPLKFKTQTQGRWNGRIRRSVGRRRFLPRLRCCFNRLFYYFLSNNNRKEEKSESKPSSSRKGFFDCRIEMLMEKNTFYLRKDNGLRFVVACIGLRWNWIRVHLHQQRRFYWPPRKVLSLQYIYLFILY